MILLFEYSFVRHPAACGGVDFGVMELGVIYAAATAIVGVIES